MDPDKIKNDLEHIASNNGVKWGRLLEYWQAEQEHLCMVRKYNSGSLLLSRALQSLFLESVELINIMSKETQTWPLLNNYKSNFLPSLLNIFQQLFATELLMTYGYPLPAYAMLRNICDHLILISAVMQGVTNFSLLSGYTPNSTPIDSASKNKRKDAERLAFKKMIGTESNLTEETIIKLKYWGDFFDLEVHSARLSYSSAISWIQGSEPYLPVCPLYNESSVAMYTNRFSEIAWMAHRLLPLLQHSAIVFPETWKEKWRKLDNIFMMQVQHFSEQQKISVGLAVIELVSKKFDYNETSCYPFENRQ